MRRIVLSGNVAAVVLLLAVLSANSAFAHCEIPCGIYDDEMRFAMIGEHITTIERSMNMIVKLADEQDEDYNQLVRWITNKEYHAHEIQDIVYQYFMTQRVKPVDAENGDAYTTYVKQLTLLHAMLVYAMKAKQTTDMSNVQQLRSLLDKFRKVYFGD